MNSKKMILLPPPLVMVHSPIFWRLDDFNFNFNLLSQKNEIFKTMCNTLSVYIKVNSRLFLHGPNVRNVKTFV